MVERALLGALLALLLYVFSGPATPPETFAPADRASPFVKERLAAAFRDDYDATARIAAELRAAGRDDDSRHLLAAWERVMLKRFLGDPHTTPKSVEAAIGEERRTAEPLEPLRSRVLRSVTVRSLELLDPTTLSRNRTRVTATNHLAVPLTRLSFRVDLEGGNVDAFHCMPEAVTAEERSAIASAEETLREAESKPTSRDVYPPPEHADRAKARRALQLLLESRAGLPVAAGTSAAMVCSEARGEARRLLGDGSRTFTATVVRPGPYVVTASVVRRYAAPDYVSEARLKVAHTPCAELMRCDEVARHAWREARRRVPQLLFVVLVAATAWLGWAAAGTLRGRAEPPSSNAVYYATALVIVASVAQFFLIYLLLNPNVGWAIAWVAGWPLLFGIIQWSLAAVLAAVLLWRREQATAFRTSALLVCLTMLPWGIAVLGTAPR